MRFTATRLPDVYEVDLEPHVDDRGFYARAYCAEEFEAHGLKPVVAQCNISFSNDRGTLRGLHYQIAPATEAKFIRCISGAVYDVIIDLRPDSPTYLQHHVTELTESNWKALYIPEMFAHGCQALTDRAAVFYSVTEFYAPGMERGIRYDDPFFSISWPLDVTRISAKDRSWPDFRPERIPAEVIESKAQ